MSVVLRCPSCSAKLRLDEAPPLGTMIDCPKCDTAFPVRNTTVEDAPKPADTGKPAKPGKKNKVVETVAREFMNEFVLLGMVGGVMLGLVLALGGTWFILNRAAKIEDLVSTVPENYSVLRGVYLEQMRKMPGYKPEVDTVYTKDMQDGFGVLAKGLGLNEEKSLSYLIMAGNGTTPGPELYLFRTKDSFDKSKVDKIEGLRTSKDGSGRTFYAFDAGHQFKFLQGATVECPTKNLIVVTRNDPNGKAASDAAALALSKPSDGTQKKIGAIGRMAIKGHFWTIVRPVGGNKGFLGSPGGPGGLGGLVGLDKKEFSKLAAATKASQSFAMWTTFGAAGLRCGAGIECASSDEAKEVARELQEGPLGKGDDSDPPNNLRASLSIIGMKKTWGEFLQSLSFNHQGTAAFIRVKFDTQENRSIMFTFFAADANQWKTWVPPPTPAP